MKNLKRNVIIGGLLLNAVICIILAFILDCSFWGKYIAIGNILADAMWILIGNFIVTDYLIKVKNYKK
jgi:hypothetical protein